MSHLVCESHGKRVTFDPNYYGRYGNTEFVRIWHRNDGDQSQVLCDTETVLTNGVRKGRLGLWCHATKTKHPVPEVSI